MDKTVTENLFLLEFLVDKVQIDPSIMQEYGDAVGGTCVSVQFLDNLPLDICEDDFAPKRRYSKEEESIKSGKSCLFSLTPAQANVAIQQFDVYVDVFKKMQSGAMPEKMQVGHSLISIVNLFKELIESVSGGNGNAPTAKTLKDTFKVTNAAGQYIGDIGMYIRMSCFGKLIVTQFQMNLEDKSVLFKDKEGHSLYRYKKASKSQSGLPGRESMGQSQGAPWEGGYQQAPPQPPRSQCPDVPCFRPGQQQFAPQQRYGGELEKLPCNECGAMQMPVPVPAPSNPAGCYQEIGAQMGPNALTIRVHKESNKVESMNDDDDEGCSCTPGNYGKPKGNRTNGGGGGGGAVCVRPNDQNGVQLRSGCLDGSVSNQPFSFRMSGCGNGAQNNNLTVVPPTCTAADGTQVTELSDPDKDLFVLRIAKKSEGADKKHNLELELTTPKGPEIKPPPKKETRDAQWNDADALEASGNGKKNGNGKKKGKGKK